jgi:hypothetical protein
MSRNASTDELYFATLTVVNWISYFPLLARECSHGQKRWSSRTPRLGNPLCYQRGNFFIC